MTEAPVPPRERAPGRNIPEVASAIVLRCLEKEPSARYASATELAQALIDALASLDGIGAADISALDIEHLPLLGDLGGLARVRSVYTVTLDNNDALSDLNGLPPPEVSIYLNDNSSLSSLAGLESVTSLDTLAIGGNNLMSLEGLAQLATVTRSLSVSGEDGIADLSGLSGLTTVGELYVGQNDALVALTGLEGITGTDRIRIHSNPTLVSLAGLSRLTLVTGDFEIHDNATLTTMDGLDALTTVGGSLYVTDNDLLASLTGLAALETVGWNLEITGNPALAAADVDAFVDGLSIGGTVTASDNGP